MTTFLICPQGTVAHFEGSTFHAGAACSRESYNLLKRIGAIEVPARLDAVFLDPMSWRSLSIRKSLKSSRV